MHNLRGSITIKTLPDECGHVIEIAVNYLQSLNEYFFKSLRFLFYFTGIKYMTGQGGLMRCLSFLRYIKSPDLHV